jgi:3-deoxy-manno-octulosonate cytidylyltransferase (CMP-KDO synthetase)
MTFHVVIPARHASTRLPGKPLLEIGGQPMIRWVAEACKKSRAKDIVVATDHQGIAALFTTTPNVSAIMTAEHHASGTDRVAEVAAIKRWGEDEIVVNVQGDEPGIPPAVIDQVAQLLQDDKTADMATLCTPILTLLEFLDPNVVKVTFAQNGAALYFSRAPIPWNRESAKSLETQREFPSAFRHLGIYAYRVATLLKLTRLPESNLEHIEKLEQLRALQAGLKIAIAQAVAVPGIGIDTTEDLERARGARL